MILSNSTTNPMVLTTQFPSVKIRAASEPRESAAVIVKPPSPLPKPKIIIANINNGHDKNVLQTGITNTRDAPSPERNKSKLLTSSIFVPPPTVPATSNVRLNGNVAVGRLQMQDLADKESSRIYAEYIDDLLEEVIQSDFEKPSIPEVILAVITDLTNDGDDDDNNHLHNEGNHELLIHMDQPYLNGSDQIYNFNQDKARSTSPIVINVNHSDTNDNNVDIDYYYTRVHQAAANTHDLSNHDTIHSTNSSNQSVGVISNMETSSNYLQV
jgi:hypothetical protein